MKKRFIVLIDAKISRDEKKFLSWIKSEKLGWWHWIDNVWLLTNNKGHLQASQIRDKLHEVFGGRNLVIELTDSSDTWSGRGPKRENSNMFKWIHDNWNRK